MAGTFLGFIASAASADRKKKRRRKVVRNFGGQSVRLASITREEGVRLRAWSLIVVTFVHRGAARAEGSPVTGRWISLSVLGGWTSNSVVRHRESEFTAVTN